jgi:hypothetical protein
MHMETDHYPMGPDQYPICERGLHLPGWIPLPQFMCAPDDQNLLSELRLHRARSAVMLKCGGGGSNLGHDTEVLQVTGPRHCVLGAGFGEYQTCVTSLATSVDSPFFVYEMSLLASGHVEFGMRLRDAAALSGDCEQGGDGLPCSP